MAFNGIIARKFALLDEYQTQLRKELDGVTFAYFRRNWALRCATERALQVMAEIVVDVAERIIAMRDAGPVATAAAAIEKLVTLGVLKRAQPYVSIVRFRNLIVHQYEQVDPALVYSIATRHLDDFTKFRNEIDACA